MPAEIPVAVPPSASEHGTTHPIGGQGPSSSLSAVQGLDLWLESFRKYEATLVRPYVWLPIESR